eukprot:CAMPEP_0172640046 /NCGR_PEP_ID=MMETSP1068-20121228/221234_1 /TAXON_ID=35684 /ORGANISM="Pseudopedinella elastica, Strain CCMP716" /LENGTH=44 /DNA_ID= /DNA_START= /DNA_END= /DNA_ORIENTATION=
MAIFGNIPQAKPLFFIDVPSVPSLISVVSISALIAIIHNGSRIF